MHFLLICLIVGLIQPFAGAAESLRVLDAKRYYLAQPGQPEWQEFAGIQPHGRQLELRFPARKNTDEATLFIRQSDVKQDWNVSLNGQKIGKLFLMESPLVCALPVSTGILKEGENVLTIIPTNERDDIIVGDLRLDMRPFKESMREAMLDIEVTDSDAHKGLPCRITIVDQESALAPVYAIPGELSATNISAQDSTPNSEPISLAARPGVVYTRDGHARLGVLAGDYTIHATRGFEYGLDTRKVRVRAGEVRRIRLQIRREVPTPGLASSDTHVHTFTYSRHGDSTIEERMLTLAGEGIELPIATDHDVLIDYLPVARRLQVDDRFTPVIGCEVTTPAGHFNIFPVIAGSQAPDNHIQDWPHLMQLVRATPGVRVVVLNHPRNIHNRFQPFAATNFNSITGANRRGPEFSFDAIELINSSALQSDIWLAFQDWFALLNYGYRVTGVGSSDCHDVSRYIVGQGRSYVACDDKIPGKINIDQACQSFLKGRVLVSMGLLTDMAVEERFRIGDLATGLGEKMRVTVKVLGPSWTSADHVELFANGVKIREQHLDASRGEAHKNPIQKAKVVWEIPRPKHDVHLVAVASGPPVTGLYWPIPKPYQPSSQIWNPRVIGATNPIWIDGDGDGKYTPPRAYAAALIEQTGIDPSKLVRALQGYDQAVAAQAAALCQTGGEDIRNARCVEALKDAAQPIREGFSAFERTLSP